MGGTSRDGPVDGMGLSGPPCLSLFDDETSALAPTSGPPVRLGDPGVDEVEHDQGHHDLLVAVTMRYSQSDTKVPFVAWLAAWASATMSSRSATRPRSSSR